jgi:hypothetical protein
MIKVMRYHLYCLLYDISPLFSLSLSLKIYSTRLHSPVLDIHEALRIKASLPSLLGALLIANALTPFFED